MCVVAAGATEEMSLRLGDVSLEEVSACVRAVASTVTIASDVVLIIAVYHIHSILTFEHQSPLCSALPSLPLPAPLSASPIGAKASAVAIRSITRSIRGCSRRQKRAVFTEGKSHRHIVTSSFTITHC